MLIYLVVPAEATHNRAGEITLTRIDDLTYEITITTFTYTLSQADRNRLEVQWGDNTFSYADRVSITRLPNFYQKNIYITQHTFPGPGIFEIVVQDPNRNKGVKNIVDQCNESDLILTLSFYTTLLFKFLYEGSGLPVSFSAGVRLSLFDAGGIVMVSAEEEYAP